MPNYELSRDLIDLKEIIGYGHFGDVHRGLFKNGANSESTLVAVKTCKDQTMADKFLEEACMFYFSAKTSNSVVMTNTFVIDTCRYHAAIRSSEYYPTDWRLLSSARLDRYGVGEIW